MAGLRVQQGQTGREKLAEDHPFAESAGDIAAQAAELESVSRVLMSENPAYRGGLAAVLAPLPWFWQLAAENRPAAIFSQYLGSVALILMGFSQLLATRWLGLETICGSLDRMYILHKWLGVTAILAVLLHDTIDADLSGLGAETLLTDLAETLGEISLYGLLVLIILSIATFVPYHLWKYTHKLMGAFFAASAFHFAFIIKPFDVTDPLGL